MYSSEGTSNNSQTGNGVTTHRDYCGNFIYEDGALKMMLFDGGYVTFDNNKTPQYHFYLKDHLGNNRVVADANGSIEQVNHYYPFGGLMAESTGDVQPYKYNGKELDRMHGLDSYDYGARWLSDGRFTTLDPHAIDYVGVSPYAYCGNNPIKRSDMNGMDWYESEDGTAAFWQEGNEKTYNIDGVTYNNVGENYNVNYGWGTVSFNQNNYQSSIDYSDILYSFIGNLYDFTSCTIDAFSSKSYKNSLVSRTIDYVIDNNLTGASKVSALAYSYKFANKLNRFNLGINIGIGVFQTYDSFQKEHNTFGYHTVKTGAKAASGILGGMAGAKYGAELGAWGGAYFGGYGAIPGAIIGGFAGSLGSTYLSENLSDLLVNKIYGIK